MYFYQELNNRLKEDATLDIWFITIKLLTVMILDRHKGSLP
jgi:hypothetical protein